MSTKNGNGVIALLVGAAIGVGFGMYLSSEKGSKVKQKIKDGFDDLKNQAKSKWELLDDGTKDKIIGKKEQLQEKVENLLSDTSYKAEEAISFLEEKLAELKKRNAKLQK